MRILLLISALCLLARPASAQDVCTSLAGGSVVANDGEFLGTIASETDSRAIFNRFGTFGSEFSAKSIWNQFGKYGSQFSELSPFNKFASTPPAIVKRGSVVAYLSTNKNIRGAVNPSYLRTCFS